MLSVIACLLYTSKQLSITNGLSASAAGSQLPMRVRPSLSLIHILSFAEMVDFLKLKRFGSLVDSETEQQAFILDLSFNPEITDELMVIYFDLNKEIFCITHES